MTLEGVLDGGQKGNGLALGPDSPCPRGGHIVTLKPKRRASPAAAAPIANSLPASGSPIHWGSSNSAHTGQLSGLGARMGVGSSQ